jgi:hypothetical protein
MRLFVDYIATKKVIASALGSIAGGATELYASSGAQITAAMSLLVKHAVAIGDIRPDVGRPIASTSRARRLSGQPYTGTNDFAS